MVAQTWQRLGLAAKSMQHSQASTKILTMVDQPNLCFNMHKDSSPCYFLGPHNYGSHQQSWWQYSPDPSRCCEDDKIEIQMVDCFIMRMLNWQLVQCLLSCLAPLQCHSIIRVFFGCRLGSCEVVNVVHQPESNKHNLPPKLQQEDIAIFA